MSPQVGCWSARLEFTNPDGSVDREAYQGEWGFPEWQAQAALRFEWDRWSMTWETRYLVLLIKTLRMWMHFADVAGISDTCFWSPKRCALS